MTVAHNEVQVTWDTGTAYNELNTGNSWAETSDAMTQSTTCVKATIQLKADQTTGTPASGDYVDWYVLPTLGDPDGASTDEYDTAGHAIYLGQTDVNTEDPAIMTVEFPVPVKGFKIRAVGSGFASTDVCTVSCTVMELTA